MQYALTQVEQKWKELKSYMYVPESPCIPIISPVFPVVSLYSGKEYRESDLKIP